MTTHFFCISTTNGTPIYVKKRGEAAENLPYSTVASFYSVNLFCKTHNVEITATRYQDNGVILWKEIETFCFVANSNYLPARSLEKLIKSSYNAMIMHIGLKEIRSIKNIERFKRDLTSSFHQMIEKLTDLAENDIFDYNESMICHEAVTVNNKLQSFSDHSSLPYCFILVRNKILCATEAFKCLAVDEKKLLEIILANNLLQKRDIPIYLPVLSPFLAYRLVNLPLIKDVTIGIICGQNPPLAEIDIISQQFWQDSYDDLLSAVNVKSLPFNIELDSIVLGYLIVNHASRKYVISNQISQTTNRKQIHRMQILVSFFNQLEALNDCFDDDPVTLNELYYVSDYHKCHALTLGENTICVLYSNIPTHAMKFFSEEILHKIHGDKSRLCGGEFRGRDSPGFF